MLGLSFSPFVAIDATEAASILRISVSYYKSCIVKCKINQSIRFKTISSEIKLHNFWDLLEFMVYERFLLISTKIVLDLPHYLVDGVADLFDSRDADGFELQSSDIVGILEDAMLDFSDSDMEDLQCFDTLCDEFLSCFSILLSRLEFATRSGSAQSRVLGFGPIDHALRA